MCAYMCVYTICADFKFMRIFRPFCVRVCVCAHVYRYVCNVGLACLASCDLNCFWSLLNCHFLLELSQHGCSFYLNFVQCPKLRSSLSSATAIIMLIILSLYEMKGQQGGKKRLFLDYCSLDALDTNVSMVLASMTSWGRSFQNPASDGSQQE